MNIKNINFKKSPIKVESPEETFKRIFKKDWPGEESSEILDMKRELGILDNLSSETSNLALQKALLSGWRPFSYRSLSFNSRKAMESLNELPNNEFQTSDFYLTVFLRTNGLRIRRLDKTNPRNVKFIFEDCPARKSLVQDYLYGDPLVPLKEFVNYIKEVKNLIYLNY